MKLSDFDYKLPDKYLAQYPSDERDECKLMLLNRKEEKIEHLVFKDMIDFYDCLLYTSPSPRDRTRSRMPSSA